MQLKDPTHTATNLDFAILLNSMGKIGVSNIQLYLLGTTAVANGSPPFSL